MPRVSGLLGGWTVSGQWGPCLPHAKTLSLGQMASQWFIAERSDVSLYFCEACFFFGGADGDVDGLVLSMLRGVVWIFEDWGIPLHCLLACAYTGANGSGETLGGFSG